MIYYVTKDIERAVGFDLDKYEHIFIVSNKSPLADLLAKKYPDKVKLNKVGYLSTLELLKKFKNDISNGEQILVFKNSTQIERLCQEQEWQLLNPPAELVNKFERKISQYGWLKSLAPNFQFPATRVDQLRNLNYSELSNELGEQFIVQYDVGHTGASTQLIFNQSEFEKARVKFPKREVRVSKYIKGDIFTLTGCVMSNEVLTGQVSQQLTGLPELTDNPLATVGNDWGAAGNKLTSDRLKIEHIASEVGKAMGWEGWRGLFGIDVVLEAGTGHVYLIEINARQPASAGFETQLTHMQGAAGPMDWQLVALIGGKGQDTRNNGQYTLSALQVILRKKTGPLWKRSKNISQVGEYTPELKLIVVKPIFDISEKSANIFIIPNFTSSEIIKIQSHRRLNEIY